jgi:alpha-mannosidase
MPLEDLIPLYEADQRAVAAEVELELLTPELVLRPGELGEITVRLRNATASQIRGEAQLVSPFGTWAQARSRTPLPVPDRVPRWVPDWAPDWVPDWVRDFTAAPAADITLSFTVAAPATARPGQHWWALVKMAYFGRVRYTDPAAVIVVAG